MSGLSFGSQRSGAPLPSARNNDCQATLQPQSPTAGRSLRTLTKFNRGSESSVVIEPAVLAHLLEQASGLHSLLEALYGVVAVVDHGRDEDRVANQLQEETTRPIARDPRHVTDVITDFRDDPAQKAG